MLNPDEISWSGDHIVHSTSPVSIPPRKGDVDPSSQMCFFCAWSELCIVSHLKKTLFNNLDIEIELLTVRTTSFFRQHESLGNVSECISRKSVWNLRPGKA